MLTRKMFPSQNGYAQAAYDPKNRPGKQSTGEEIEEELEAYDDDMYDDDEVLEAEEEDEAEEDAKM